MLYCAGLDSLPDQMVLTFFVLCGLTRLVRFNLTVDQIPKGPLGKALYMEGLPTAYAALIVGCAVAIFAWKGEISEETRGQEYRTRGHIHWATPIVAVLGMAMASRRLRLRFDGAYSVPAATAAVGFLGWLFL